MSSPTPLAWVHKRDGRLVPFEADRISRALFAAAESLGQPDAFLARELTDSILHFLRVETSDSAPTTAQIADLVIKVVRELGQPALARAFADAQTRKAESGKQAEEDQRQNPSWKAASDDWDVRPGFRSAPSANTGPTPRELVQWIEQLPSPASLVWRAGRACLNDYTLREVYTRDLVAAQSAGLLTLMGLDTPLELGAQVLGITGTTGTEMVETLEEARGFAGEYVALDGPEFLLARLGTGEEGLRSFLRELAIGLRVTRLQAVINLNSAVPPPWAEELAVGPLFEEHRQAPESAQIADLQHHLLEHLLAPGAFGSAIRIDWHLGERDFFADTPPSSFLPRTRREDKVKENAALLRLARAALEGAPLAFVFDRPRRPIALAEGLDRQHPTVLLTVGLHLPQLMEQSGPSVAPELFLRKLESLARLALSAAGQKRDFLRRHRLGRANVGPGFLLDRARLVAVPVGLDHATRTLLGQGFCAAGPARQFANQVVHRLHDILRQDASSYLLDTCVDSPLGRVTENQWPLARAVAGLTSSDTQATTKEQLQAASPLHAIAGTGTVVLPVSEDRPLTAEELVDLLRYAWQQTEVVRVRLVRKIPQARQQTAPWETSGGRNEGPIRG